MGHLGIQGVAVTARAYTYTPRPASFGIACMAQPHGLHAAAACCARASLRRLHEHTNPKPSPALAPALALTLTRRANPKHTPTKESIGLWPPGEWPMALPSIDHLTSSEAHARVKKDQKACVAQPRGLGGFIYQPLALRSKPSEDNARIKRG